MAWETGPAAIDTAAFEEEAKPARKRANPRKAATPKAAEGLMNALAFVKGATAGVGDTDVAEAAKYVRIANQQVVAFDGWGVSAGHPIEEDIVACPHYSRLADGLKNVGKSLSISLSDGGRMTLSGEKAKFVVPCFPPDSMPPVFPDAPIAAIDDRIKTGFESVLKLAKDNADTIHECSVLLRANTVIGCNGVLALEYWHGIDLPPGLAIPQRAAKMLANTKLKMERFGFTWGRSATFWFEGGAWIRTQLTAGEWPEALIDRQLNVFADPVEMPGLYEALDAIESFSEDGAVHFHENKLKTTYAAETEGGPLYGASYDLPGLEPGTHVSARLLRMAKPAAGKIDYRSHPDRILFYNEADNLRGVLMKRQ